MNIRIKNLSLLASGASIISFSAVFVQTSHVGPFTAGFYRLLIGGCTLCVIALYRKETFNKGWTPLALGAGAGLLFALDLSFWHHSIIYIGPGMATVLANFQAIFLAAAGVLFFRERLSMRLVFSILFALAGIVLLAGVTHRSLPPQYHTGIAFGIVTALCYTGYILVLRKSQTIRESLSPAANMTVICFTCCIIMGAEALASGESFIIPGMNSLASLLAYGLLCQALAWMLISRALPGVEASRAGLVLLLQPALAIIWDWVFFERYLGIPDGAGALLALGAIYLGSTSRTLK